MNENVLELNGKTYIAVDARLGFYDMALCDGCAFEPDRPNCGRIKCVSDERHDGRQVVWVERRSVPFCGMKITKEVGDPLSGCLEWETETLCGEGLCAEECWKSWSYCPYCGKPFVVNQEQK